MPVNTEEDENGEVEIQAYSFIENEDERRRIAANPRRLKKTNGTWLKKSSTALWKSKNVRDIFSPFRARNSETQERLGTFFTYAKNKRPWGKSGDSPAPEIKRRNVRGSLLAQLPEIGESWNIRGTPTLKFKWLANQVRGWGFSPDLTFYL